MAKNDLDEPMSVGIDIGKDVFHLVGFDHDGQLVLRKKIKRLALVAAFEQLPRCIVGMEAFQQGSKERLQRCRGDCRGRIAPQS
ncbi:hypothetical protein [Leisingera sp. M658]|uniref:hypothetical protein n=1 Tax=Leisingera sp. M658 TaxID=2867015 RepID=UPI0038FC977B